MKCLKPGHHIAKILLFRTHHPWSSTTELILGVSPKDDLRRRGEGGVSTGKTTSSFWIWPFIEFGRHLVFFFSLQALYINISIIWVSLHKVLHKKDWFQKIILTQLSLTEELSFLSVEKTLLYMWYKLLGMIEMQLYAQLSKTLYECNCLILGAFYQVHSIKKGPTNSLWSYKIQYDLP